MQRCGPVANDRCAALAAVDVEPVRVGVVARVAVGRREHGRDQRARRQLDAGELRRRAWSGACWSRPASASARPPRSPGRSGSWSASTSASWSGCWQQRPAATSAIRSLVACSPPTIITFRFEAGSPARVSRSPSTSECSMLESTRVVGLALERVEHRRDRLVRPRGWRRRRSPASRGRRLEVGGARSPARRTSAAACRPRRVQPERALQHAHRERLGELGHQVDAAALGERRRSARSRSARSPRRGSGRSVGPERRVDDRADAVVVLALRAEQVLAERPVQRRGLGLAGEDVRASCRRTRRRPSG